MSDGGGGGGGDDGGGDEGSVCVYVPYYPKQSLHRANTPQ